MTRPVFAIFHLLVVLSLALPPRRVQPAPFFPSPARPAGESPVIESFKPTPPTATPTATAEAPCLGLGCTPAPTATTTAAPPTATATGVAPPCLGWDCTPTPTATATDVSPTSTATWTPTPTATPGPGVADARRGRTAAQRRWTCAGGSTAGRGEPADAAALSAAAAGGRDAGLADDVLRLGSAG